MNYNSNISFDHITNVTNKCEILDDITSWNSKLTDQLLFTVLHINLNSIRPKWDLLCVELKSVLEHLDVLVLTEIKVNEEEALAFQLRGYHQISRCRVKNKGGGVMVFCRDSIKIENLDYNFDEADSLVLKLIDVKRKFECTLLAIYRAPGLNEIDDVDFWLQNAAKRDGNIIMIGDINVDIKRKTNENVKYFNMLNEHTLLPMIREPTREEMLNGRPTSTCLDHVNIRVKKHSCIASVIRDKLADHYYVALRIISSQSNSTKSKIVKKTILDNRKIQNEIEKISWNRWQDYDDPDLIYSEVTSKFNDIYSECTKELIYKEIHALTPWVNQRVKNEIKLKQSLLRTWQNNKNNLFNYERYKKQRNIVTNLIKKEKRIYMYKKFDEAKGDMGKTWKLINEMLDRKLKVSPEEILQKNFQTQDLKSLANKFNSNFVQQIKNLQAKNQGPDLRPNTIDYVPPSTSSSMYLRKVRPEDVKKILKNMKKSGRGLDGVRNRDIVENWLLFTPLLTHLVNLFIDKAMLPDRLKISCITPIYKRGKVDDVANYRPVGSMPLIEKVLEKHINNQMKK